MLTMYKARPIEKSCGPIRASEGGVPLPGGGMNLTLMGLIICSADMDVQMSPGAA